MAFDDTRAVNVLSLRIGEAKTFSVDFTPYINARERIIGVVAITVSPASGGPTVSAIGWTSNGKTLSFRLAGATIPRQYVLTFEVTTKEDGASSNQTTIADAVLSVKT